MILTVIPITISILEIYYLWLYWSLWLVVATTQVEKEALEAHTQKQEKTSTFRYATIFQNKANLFLVALSTKIVFKQSPSTAPKKQPNSLQIDLSLKLANNGKLTSDEHKKYFENNLYLYCRAGDYKLDSCPKKQTMVTSKSHGTSATANPSAATSEKSLEK